MKFNDIVKNSNKIDFLKEAYTGQFTVGFELEGVCTWDKDMDDPMDGNFYLPSYSTYDEEDNDAGGAALQLKRELDLLFDIKGSSGNSKIESDGSLNTDNVPDSIYGYKKWNFEYATKKIPFNAKNLEKIYNGLSKLYKWEIFTNDSCGFHIHLSFPEISKEEIAWIICCIAVDEELTYEILQLETEDEGTIQLFNVDINEEGEEIDGYATIHFLLNIKDAILENDYDRLDKLLNSEKYRVLHIHSDNGTLEWRGPRGFLNSGNLKTIKAFVLKWYKIVSKIANMTQVTTYQGSDVVINKRDLLSHLTLSYIDRFNSPVEQKKIEKQKNLFSMIEDDPVKLFSLNPKAMKQMWKYDPITMFQTISGLLNNDMFEEDWCELKNDIFNEILGFWFAFQISNYNDAFKIVNKLWYPMKASGKSFLSRLNETNLRMVTYICTKMILSNNDDYDLDNQGDEYVELLEDLDIFNTEIFKNEFMDLVKKQKFSSIDVKEIMKIDNMGISYVPQYMMTFLMNNRNMGYIAMIPNLAEKYQIRLIKKDPFNIQYINNPTNNVIKMALEMNPNVKDYIRGE